MKEVGVRELKRSLSSYLDAVAEGESLWVTRRGKVVAVLMPVSSGVGTQKLLNLVSGGQASWSGGKPAGADQPITIPGRPVSDLVLEDRE